MPLKIIFSALFLFLVQLPANAQIKLPSFNTLCEYDPDCDKVGRIKNKTLQIKKIPQELLDYYKRLRGPIISIARQYNIDPVTLVLTPLAENTMNVNITDKIQNSLVASGDAPEAVFLGQEMSVGPGQIYPSAAMKVENLAAQIENRPLRNKKEVTKLLLTPEGALRYAAAIIRQAQDIYFAHGYDISRRPEILSTLYNIGRPSQRVKQTVRNKREPYPNYFGFFVGKNYYFVKNELSLPSTID